jgi:thiopurine S-methyltransferase
MDDGFWQQAWATGRLRGEAAGPHPDLVTHAPTVLVGARRILVPLCGRSADLIWLAGRWPEIVGIELVEPVVTGFAAGHGLIASHPPVGGFRGYRRDALTVLAGDFLTADPARVGTFDGGWDRGALVAMPPGRRPAYARVLRALLRPGATILLETYEIDHVWAAGPPFSVPDTEVRRLFDGAAVRVLERRARAFDRRYRGRMRRTWRQNIYAIRTPAGERRHEWPATEDLSRSRRLKEAS